MQHIHFLQTHKQHTTIHTIGPPEINYNSV